MLIPDTSTCVQACFLTRGDLYVPWEWCAPLPDVAERAAQHAQRAGMAGSTGLQRQPAAVACN